MGKLPRLSPRTYSAKTSCMAKLDRLQWQAGFAIQNCGLRIGLRTTDPMLLPALRGCVPPGSSPSDSAVVDRMFSLVGGGAGGRGVRRYHLGYEDFELVARSFELEQASETLQGSLRHYLASAAKKRLFVHAGVVGWHGRAIVIPGRSLSGKTTLVAELLRAGATYYSDEYAVFDAQGRVHPFAKALTVRTADGGLRRQVKAEALGGRTGKAPLPLGLIVVTGYKAGALFRPEEILVSKAAVALLSNTVAARQRPELALNTFQRAVRKARAVKSARGEARGTAKQILELATA